MNLSKSILVADVHLRDGPYSDDLVTSERFLDELLKIAIKHEARRIFILGDLWHKKNNTPITVLNLIYQFIQKAQKQNIIIIYLRGNHEAPDKEQPELSLVKLFDYPGVVVVNQPKILEICGWHIYLMPWYPGYKLAEELKKVRKTLFLKPHKKRVFMGHFGVAEGKVGDQELTLGKEASIDDLSPDKFQHIFLGDYHLPQTVKYEHCRYLGCPFPQNFANNYYGGVWLWDKSESASKALMNIPLSNSYPGYYKWEILSKEDLVLAGYRPTDRNRIWTPHSLSREVSALYPEAMIFLTDVDTATTTDRLKNQNDQNHFEVYKEFCKLKKWPKEQKILGLGLLKRAIEGN